MKIPQGTLTVRYLAKNMLIVIGIVLVWRGVWHLLDWIDENMLDGNTLWTSAGGIVIGLLILYIPDKDLKELEKL